MKRRGDDILAFFDHPGTSNGPTEAVNGLLEHLRGTARGSRSIVNYVARCLLDAGGFRPLFAMSPRRPHILHMQSLPQ